MASSRPLLPGVVRSSRKVARYSHVMRRAFDSARDHAPQWLSSLEHVVCSVNGAVGEERDRAYDVRWGN